MSGSQTTTYAPPVDRSSFFGSVAVSLFAEAIFVVALGIAWWTNNPALPVLLGAAATNATTVVGFWVGSSTGSRTKDQVRAARHVPPPGTVTTTRTP